MTTKCSLGGWSRALVTCGLLAFPLTPALAQPLIQEVKLTAADGAGGDVFGSSVAVSGNTAIVGARSDDGRGSAYIYVRTGTVWTEQAKLVASDGASGDSFGFSVDLEGDTALIGAFEDDGSAGAAYVFVRSGTVWTEQAKLVAANRSSGAALGFAVALAGDTALLAAPAQDGRGAVYAFVRSGSSWSQQAEMVSNDISNGDNFGNSLALDADTALIGASGDDALGNNSGAAYVFVRTGTSWSQQAKLQASDGAANDLIGSAGTMAIDGDTALLGSPRDDAPAGIDAGSVYVFVRSGTSWLEQTKLTASDSEAGAVFGRGIALSDGTAVIGAFGVSDNGTNAGAAYLFVGGGASWSEAQKLLASDGAANDLFSELAVAVDGDTVLVGARADDDLGSSSGSAYVFAPEPLVCVSIDDDDESIDYRRGWHSRSDSAASGSGYHRRMGQANGTTPTARVRFEGTEITYHYAMSDIGGSADVYLDGVFQETVIYGAGGTGPDSPSFGFSSTYSASGNGPHTLRIDFQDGTAYVDGFEVCGPPIATSQMRKQRFATASSGVGFDASAVEFRSHTETFSASELEGLLVTRTFSVTDDDVEVSVTVEGASLAPVLTLLSPSGVSLATGISLLGGSAVGLDQPVSAPGLYQVSVILPSLIAGDLRISVAHTYAVE
ncbi:hypothetical protein Hoch_1055 [Haliangium ochraceum DSM 14365]|uniref:FG-GAP repeat protein n=2 Tax=Haliangium ochraceum TaxID=80816 RepID=D0LQT7_HALO1|nr:hypothetical protein Hoch_1055 [Haliangium ochraceum DSM 14365]